MERKVLLQKHLRIQVILLHFLMMEIAQAVNMIGMAGLIL